ncbi:atp-dependent dna helicase pif1 [Fusarium subglutinans]|uniref:ATP-dependent DNA helicase n=1 Tax=Gibberella subglutinans TaxID=42677 RepID=A0A8H5PTH6_GIBSU|nr:atp-dependent dna helicase pif1 [Fusarium subglutinans]KAF5602712.1 atp-dependent dna helicase pif1 [Fusarium subglutinans]
MSVARRSTSRYDQIVLKTERGTPPGAPLKRKRDANAQAPTSANEPKRFQRSSSYISIHSSSDEDEAPKANSSSRANAKSSPQQPRSNKNTMANFLAMGKQKPSQALQQRPQQKPSQEPPQKSSPAKPSQQPPQTQQQRTQHKPQNKPSQMPPQITQEMPLQTRREILMQKIQQLEQHIAEQKSQMIPQQLPPMQQPRTQPRPQQFPQQIPQQIPQQPRPMPLLPSNPSTSGPADNEDDFLAVDPVPEPTLCKEQQDLLDLIMSGRNVFFTGSAGCGKSTVLKAAVKKLRAAGKTVHITAPTGRAALGVNGVTTWSYMSWMIDDMKLPIGKLKGLSHRPTVKERLAKTDVLIIDEISMVENHHFQRMNEGLKSARCWSPQHGDYFPNAPAFGGVQLLVTGDFCQLPPVKPFKHCIRCGLETTANAEWSPTEWNCRSNCGPFYVEDQWAFRSAAWEDANFTHVHLKEIHRQSDESFVKMLQKCRLGIPFSKKEEKMLLRQHPDDAKFRNVTKLFAHKKAVQTENRVSFERLPGEATIYEAIDGFDWKEHHTELEHYKDKARRDKYSDVPYVHGTLEQCKESPLDAYVEMKVNALVMLKVNLDTEKGLVNGSQGIVVGWEPYDPEKLPNTKKATLLNIDVLAGHHADWRARKIRQYAERRGIRRWPIVRFNNGITRPMYPSIVVNTLGATEPYSVLYRTQLPLVLAWAVSIHKSQGMTLTHVTTDLGQAWEQALKYVALSRVTSLDGLAILKPGGWKKRQSCKDSLAVVESSSHEVREFLEDKFGRNLFTDLEGNR